MKSSSTGRRPDHDMEQDTLHRFLIENTQVRGEWVHLDESWQNILTNSPCPAPLRQVLGEAAAAVCLMSATIKFKGSLILQINGNGPVSMLVMQATSEGEIRGLAHWDGDLPMSSLPDLFGEGRIVISIITNKDNDRYQGVVGLEGQTLADCLQTYFEQSEQLNTRLHLAADHATAAGLLIQRLPEQQAEHDEDSWERAVSLTDTLQAEELLTLDASTLLYRLFHEEDLRLFDPQAIRYQCSCSQEKIEEMIRSLGKEEAHSIIDEQSLIEINCDFCNTRYTLDAIDVERVFDIQITGNSHSLH